LMARLLGRHDRVHTLPELHFFEQIWDPNVGPGDPSKSEMTAAAARLLAIAEEGYLHHDRHAHMDEARSLVDGELGAGAPTTMPDVYFAVLRSQAMKHGASVPCEQTPSNVFFARQIMQGSDEARIVCMVRDPRDVVLSQRSKWRRRVLADGKNPRRDPRREALRSAVAYHPVNVAILWRASSRAIRAVKDDRRVLVVRYEDLVSNTATVTKRVCDFLELDWNPHLLDVERTGSSKLPDDASAVGVYPDRAGAWRRGTARERADVVLCQWVCGSEMADDGYEKEPLRASWIAVAGQLASWPVRSLLGLLMNLSRIGSPLHAVRTRLSKSF
jgi:hypothetical protein